MSFEEYLDSVAQPEPPIGLSPILRSLWWDKKGEWERSHDIAQDIHSKDGSWIHAYLHRKEGDLWNADYWYSRAGKTRPDTSHDIEWESIVRSLL